MGIVKIDTLEMSGETSTTKAGKYQFTYQLGTIEVALNGETRRLPCKVSEAGTIYVQGVSGRYRTGTVAWPASVSYTPERGEFVFFGRDERQGRCQQSSLFFAEGR